MNDHLSINVSGVGFDGTVAKEFEKTSRGLVNYVKVSMQNYFNFQPIDVAFENKFSEFDGKYLMLNIANTRQFGNNAFIAPQADFSDGILEIALVKKFPFYYFAKFGYQLFTKNLLPNNYLKYIRNFFHHQQRKLAFRRRVQQNHFTCFNYCAAKKFAYFSCRIALFLIINHHINRLLTELSEVIFYQNK